MEDKLRLDLLADACPGWAELLNKFWDDLQKADPDARIMFVKEKYGSARVNLSDYNEDTIELTELLLSQTAITCHLCGKPGRQKITKGWTLPWCYTCKGGTTEASESSSKS